ncbi:hypothetical protein [Halobacillus mangrovi]|uniref:Uncharacterized protein n=1 Tax=Halobacillus mangrovi TaxID=402384 RepID=A0A1W5ZRD9_9BACI|nr:hypothetical protein [Halobacillus mangrovi]ARI75866.1 hypothetical protein HM131_03055 [Halobacillus mangrovi]
MTFIKSGSPTRTLWIALTILSIITISFINLNGSHIVENLVRSFCSFIIAPSLILLANRYHLWFRKSLRWVVHLSQRLVLSTFIFFMGTLLSYELSLMIPKGVGYPIHVMLLIICSIVYWAPLILRCTFIKPLSFIHKFGYFTLTTILFFTYHELSYYFYASRPTSGYMYSGMIFMLVTLWLIVFQWSRAEKETDRMTVKGYVHSLTNEKNM